MLSIWSCLKFCRTGKGYLNVAKIMIPVCERVENIMEAKREKCFPSLHYNGFKQILPQGHLKTELCGKGLTPYQTTKF